jgi:hypothetical protein
MTQPKQKIIEIHAHHEFEPCNRPAQSQAGEWPFPSAERATSRKHHFFFLIRQGIMIKKKFSQSSSVTSTDGSLVLTCRQTLP